MRILNKNHFIPGVIALALIASQSHAQPKWRVLFDGTSCARVSQHPHSCTEMKQAGWGRSGR
jgi:hypothetical protein